MLARLLQIFNKTSLFLQRIEKIVGALFLGMMLFVMLINVFLRYVLLIPINWSDELNNYLFIWMGFLACAYTSADDGHVRVSLLTNLMPPVMRKAVDILMNIIMFVAFFIFIGPTWRLLGKLPRSNSLQIPLKFVYAILPISFALMSFHTLKIILTEISALMDRKHARPAVSSEKISVEGK